MAQYWTRKDDESEELRTLKPWEETISNGDKFFPDPDGEEETEKEETEKED